MRTPHNVLIGRDGEEYIYLESSFGFEGGSHKGTTGHTLRVVTEAEHDERMSVENARENLEDVWRSQVADGATIKGLDEFVAEVLNIDGESAIFDLSYSSNHDEVIEAFNARMKREDGDVDESQLGRICEASSCGRIFRKDGVNGKKWAELDELFPGWEEAVKLIEEYEDETIAEEKKRHEAAR